MHAIPSLPLRVTYSGAYVSPILVDTVESSRARVTECHACVVGVCPVSTGDRGDGAYRAVAACGADVAGDTVSGRAGVGTEGAVVAGCTLTLGGCQLDVITVITWSKNRSIRF